MKTHFNIKSNSNFQNHLLNWTGPYPQRFGSDAKRRSRNAAGGTLPAGSRAANVNSSCCESNSEGSWGVNSRRVPRVADTAPLKNDFVTDF